MDVIQILTAVKQGVEESKNAKTKDSNLNGWVFINRGDSYVEAGVSRKAKKYHHAPL